MNDSEPTPDDPRSDPSRSDLVRIRLPGGGHEWVTPEAFNLISEKEFQDSDRLRRLRRQRDLALAAAAAVVLVAAALAAWWLRGRDAGPVDTPLPGAGTKAPAVVAPPATDAPAASEEPSPSPSSSPAAASGGGTSPAPAVAGEIEDTVRAWARAWSAQDTDAYLTFYSAGFRVPDGLDRSAWEDLRRQRIESPQGIAVTVSDVETTVTGDATATARFGQGYRAPGYRDWVLKTFELRREAGGWRIVEERSALIEIGRSE